MCLTIRLNHRSRRPPNICCLFIHAYTLPPPAHPSSCSFSFSPPAATSSTALSNTLSRRGQRHFPDTFPNTSPTRQQEDGGAELGQRQTGQDRQKGQAAGTCKRPVHTKVGHAETNGSSLADPVTSRVNTSWPLLTLKNGSFLPRRSYFSILFQGCAVAGVG